MTILTGLNIDPNVPESGGDFIVLPPGKYQAVIIGDELKDTKAGNGKMLVLNLQIQDRGEFFHTELLDRLNIINPSEKAQAIGQGVLKRICNLTGAPFPPPDTRKMYGKPLTITVKVEEFESNNSGKMLQSNKISGYGKPEKVSIASKSTPQQQAEPQPETEADSEW
jgi:hypothetical protein